MAEETASGLEVIESPGNFDETPYEDASWEIVGEVNEELEFVPLEVDVMKAEELAADPMFADYGGLPEEESPKRWHLPDGMNIPSSGSLAVQQEKEEEELVRLREEELEAIKQQAFQEGKAEGVEEAAIQNAQKVELLEQRFVTLLPDLQNQVNEVIEQIEKNAVELSLNISRKIIEGAVEINPEYIVQIIREGLSLTGSAVVRKIRISPQDMEFIEVIGLDRQFDADDAWEWEADPSIRAGCVLETSAGEIDFQLDAAWERIKEQVIKITR